jgi:hypothetical protein
MLLGLWVVSPEEKLIRYRDGVYDRVSIYVSDLVNAPGEPCDQDWAYRVDKTPLVSSHAGAAALFRIPWEIDILLDDRTMQRIGRSPQLEIKRTKPVWDEQPDENQSTKGAAYEQENNAHTDEADLSAVVGVADRAADRGERGERTEDDGTAQRRRSRLYADIIRDALARRDSDEFEL